ncbi:hypothetical protein [Halegenticoccus soli]|uniref:hypothetical protein n=1 Tax=Halegenticoccus soli TaxID=1985678 RepID=UPI00117AC410|nr:hypothetical protein [Halegenticoccus soli]
MRQARISSEEVTGFLLRNPRVALLAVLFVLMLATQGSAAALESGGDLLVSPQSSHSATNGP